MIFDAQPFTLEARKRATADTVKRMTNYTPVSDVFVDQVSLEMDTAEETMEASVKAVTEDSGPEKYAEAVRAAAIYRDLLYAISGRKFLKLMAEDSSIAHDYTMAAAQPAEATA